MRKKLAVHLKQMDIKRNQLPDFLGVFIKFGNSFSTTMLVWQTAIFANFVYPAKNEQIGVGTAVIGAIAFLKLNVHLGIQRFIRKKLQFGIF